MKELDMKVRAVGTHVLTWIWQMKEDAVIAEQEGGAVEKALEKMGVTERLVENMDMHASRLLEQVTSYLFVNYMFP